jgi:hypothetical protein
VKSKQKGDLIGFGKISKTIGLAYNARGNLEKHILSSLFSFMSM